MTTKMIKTFLFVMMFLFSANTFAAASKKTIEQLNTPFRSVYPVAAHSPALHADIFIRQTYQPEFLSELKAVREQLVSINLTNLPIRDEDITL